jgi:predicted transposase/invertase (TIGR01784 family)
MGLLPKDADILPPSDDRIFKVILTSPLAKPALMDLISAIIGRPILDVVVCSNVLPIGDTNEKDESFDVNCRVDDGTQIDLEMAASRIEEESDKEHKNLKGKSVYYLCDLHSSQPARGLRRYDKLPRTYQVTFCSYTVFPKRKTFVNPFSLRHDEDGELLTNAVCAIFVELSKLKEILKKPIGDMTDLEKWAIFLRYSDVPKYRDIVNEIIETKEALKMGASLLMSVSKDERERAAFRSRRMHQTDMQSNMATAEDRGGKKKALVIARNLLKMNLPFEQIVSATGLTFEEVEALRNAN